MGLRHLSVKNFAIVDALELDFSDGMTVFTGETGAGKSIMIDALGLVLGDRAQATVVRKGAEKATISAVFDISRLPEAQALLDEQDIEYEDGECLLRRQINNDGRSRAFINGVAVPSQTLRALSDYLIDIHGQHAHQSLLRRDVQRMMLDEFAGHDDLTAAVQSAADQWKRTSTDLAALSSDPEQREAQKDLLRYQIEELETAIVSPEDMVQALEQHKRLANITRIAEACQKAAGLFDEQGAHTSAQLQQTLNALQNVVEYEPKIASITNILTEAGILLDEAETQLRHVAESLDFDQQEFDIIERRLGELHDLARKHHTQIEDLPDILNTLRIQLEQLENNDHHYQSLLAANQSAMQAYQQSAQALSASRHQYASQLSHRITQEMQLLGMAGGRFDVLVTDKQEVTPSASGADRIEFMVSANPGQDLLALNKVASGGELSRISLAIQVITSQGKGVPTLVFDEVDVGIGGGIAEIVGHKMRELGSVRQVLCVTHLAQVASLGHHHLLVSKESTVDKTWTHISSLNQDQRINEIARMLGGIKITDQTLAHAREMLAVD